MSGRLRCSFLATACLLASGCAWETTDASYSTAKEVIDSGYLDNGWIPRWLPPDATHIQETHNIDSNVSELSFSIPGAESLRLPADCSSIAFEDVFPARIQRSWWPNEQDLRTSYTLFRCPADATDHTFVGVSAHGRRVLHWRTYAR